MPTSNVKGSAARKARRVSKPHVKVIEIPRVGKKVNLEVESRQVTLTNLGKVFWPDEGTTKAQLLQYYANVSPVLLPHLRDRAMVMKRYPNGVTGKHFFMKRAPSPRPDWIQTCEITHSSGNVINFPIIQDLPALLWVINLGCIDLNQWYARCDDVDRPDVLHFDLDPVNEVPFEKVKRTALHVRDALERLEMSPLAKTTGSRGIHIYIPIVRNVTQKEVWTFAKAFAQLMEQSHPELITAEYRKEKRPAGHILVDYNQNAWGRTLASVYSVRPRPTPTVSTPVSWAEVEGGVEIEDFTIHNVPERIAEQGDLWAPMLKSDRFDLGPLLERSRK